MMLIKEKIRAYLPWTVPAYHLLKQKRNIIANLFDKPVIILLYHRVADLVSDPQYLSVDINRFDQQIHFLKENYPVLRFEDNWKNIKEPSVVITFDDGYADNYFNALPILERYQVPATVFVSTANIGKDDEFWWDDLERLILLNDNLPKEYYLSASIGNIKCNFQDKKQILKSYQNLHPFLKNMQSEERQNVLRIMQAELHASVPPRPMYRTMTENELRKMDMSPYITIGGHTVTHTCLSLQSIAVQREEILLSKEKLEQILLHPLTTFSYPFGGKMDYTRDTVCLLQRAGYKKVASNYPGQIHSWSMDSFEYPRCIVRNWSMADFKRYIESFFIAI